MSSQNDCSATAPIFSEKLLTNLAWKSIIVNESRCYPIDGCLSEYKFYVIAFGSRRLHLFYAYFLQASRRAAKVMRTIANWNMSEYVTLIIPPPQLKIEEVRYTSSIKEATAYRMGSTHSNYMAKSVIVNLSIRI